MPPAGFEAAIPAAKTYALDRAATGIGICLNGINMLMWRGVPFHVQTKF
jgi:hypothetical protein